jgi:hypothetical protein
MLAGRPARAYWRLGEAARTNEQITARGQRAREKKRAPYVLTVVIAT